MSYQFPSTPNYPDSEYTPTTGGGALTIGWFYITDSGVYELPQLATLTEGMVRILVADGVTPTLNTFTGDNFTMGGVTNNTLALTSQSLVEVTYGTTSWNLVEYLINPSIQGVVSQADFDAAEVNISNNAANIEETEIFALAGLVL